MDRRELLIELARAEDELEQVLAQPSLERDMERQFHLELSVRKLKQSLRDLDDDARGRRTVATSVREQVDWVAVEAQRVELTEKRDRVQAEVSSLRAKRNDEVDLHFVAALETHLATLKHKLQSLPVPEHLEPPQVAAGTWVPLTVGAPVEPVAPPKHPFVKLWSPEPREPAVEPRPSRVAPEQAVPFDLGFRLDKPPSPTEPFVRLVDELATRVPPREEESDDARQVLSRVDGLTQLQRRILRAVKAHTADTMGVEADKLVEALRDSPKPESRESVLDVAIRLTLETTYRYPLLETKVLVGRKHFNLTPLGRALLLDDSPGGDGPFLSAVPNVFINGLVVGGRYRVPPHDLIEVAEALLLLLRLPSASTEHLSSVVLGPDFPGGGAFVPGTDFLAVYSAGRGRLTVRASVAVEDSPEGKLLVLTNRPPNCGRDVALAALKAIALKTGCERAVSDQSTRSTTRIVLALGSVDPNVVISELWNTQLCQRVPVSFNLGASSLPTFLSFRQLLKGFVDSRVSVLGERVFRARLRAVSAAYGDERRTTVV